MQCAARTRILKIKKNVVLCYFPASPLLTLRVLENVFRNHSAPPPRSRIRKPSHPLPATTTAVVASARRRGLPTIRWRHIRVTAPQRFGEPPTQRNTTMICSLRGWKWLSGLANKATCPILGLRLVSASSNSLSSDDSPTRNWTAEECNR